jgi:hypothetical protein
VSARGSLLEFRRPGGQIALTRRELVDERQWVSGAQDQDGSMWYLALKAVISGMLIAAVSEYSKRYPGVGGLLASLPLVAVLGMLWAWREKTEPDKIAALSASTFWFVLPSLPMFLLIPQLLHRGWGVGFALLCGCLLTMALYLLLVWTGPRFGINL